MGFLRNIAFKTAIKRSLLDLTNGIELLQKNLIAAVSFGEAVMLLSENELYKPYLESGNLEFQTWEQRFFGMVFLETKKQMGADRLLFESNEDHTTLIQLVSEWIVPYSGDPEEIIELYSGEKAQKKRQEEAQKKKESMYITKSCETCNYGILESFNSVFCSKVNRSFSITYHCEHWEQK